MACFGKKVKKLDLTQEPFLDVNMKLGSLELKYFVEKGTWTNNLKDVPKKDPAAKEPEPEVETDAMKEKRLELEEKLEWIVTEVEKHRKIAKDLQKEFLLAEIKNELLTHIAVEKNSTYNEYVKDIEDHK